MREREREKRVEEREMKRELGEIVYRVSRRVCLELVFIFGLGFILKRVLI